MSDAPVLSDRPIRVLLVGPCPPPNGGIATVVRNILGFRFRSPIELDLFDDRKAPRPSGTAYRILNGATYRLGVFGLWGMNTLYVLRAFQQRLDRFQPDVVHLHSSHGYGFWSCSLMARIARGRGIRTLMHFHGSSFDVFYDALGPLHRWVFRRFLAWPDRLVALSRSWRDWYGRFVPLEKLEVIPNCIDWKRFQEPHPPHDATRPTILFVGMIEARRKGVHDLVAAVPRVLREFPGARFVLLGADNERVEEALSVDEATRRALEFGGDRDAAAVALAYQQADVFVLPSYEEGMPMVLLESMASGLPVISTPVNAIPEVVTDGVNGLLTPPGKPEALAERILDLLRSAELRLRLGEAAREFIREHHDLASQAPVLEHIYRELADR